MHRTGTRDSWRWTWLPSIHTQRGLFKSKVQTLNKSTCAVRPRCVVLGACIGLMGLGILCGLGCLAYTHRAHGEVQKLNSSTCGVRATLLAGAHCPWCVHPPHGTRDSWWTWLPSMHAHTHTHTTRGVAINPRLGSKASQLQHAQCTVSQTNIDGWETLSLLCASASSGSGFLAGSIA